QRTIETIAKPIDSKTHHGPDKSKGTPLGEGIANPGEDHADKTDERQIIRVHPIRQTAGNVDEKFLFERRQQALLLARSRFEVAYQRLFRPARLVNSFFTIGRASLTVNARPPKSLPLNAAIAFSASSSFIETNPNPFERPVSRSVMMLTDSTDPIC